MPERKGAAYRISSTRPASHHGEHTQTTQATPWAVSIEQAQTINPGPLVGTEARDISGMYNVKKSSPFGGGDYHMGTIRQAPEYGGRWTGVMSGQHAPGGDIPAFNVRTEHRARVAATALASMSGQEARRRAGKASGLQASFGRRYNQRKGR
jgi:hypothetical protein